MGKMENAAPVTGAATNAATNAAATAATTSVTGKLSLTPQADGLKWPEPPVFDNPYEERLHRKQRLAVGYRIFSMHGFDFGIAGHITCRDPVLKDHFWVNPLGVHFSRIKVSDLVLVDHDGNVVQGRHDINCAAYAIHSRVHRARPDVVAAAHAHSTYGVSFSSLNCLLEPISQECCSFYGGHGLYDGYGGVAAVLEEGDLIAKAVGQGKAALMRNHGHITVGHSVEEAVAWFIRMERACEQTLLARAAGKPHVLDHETAALTASQIGSHRAGWYGLQPLVDKVLAEQPDVLN